MWEWYETFTWLGKNALWLAPYSVAVYFMGHHFGYSSGYEEGQQSIPSSNKEQALLEPTDHDFAFCKRCENSHEVWYSGDHGERNVKGPCPVCRPEAAKIFANGG